MVTVIHVTQMMSMLCQTLIPTLQQNLETIGSFPTAQLNPLTKLSLLLTSKF